MNPSTLVILAFLVAGSALLAVVVVVLLLARGYRTRKWRAVAMIGYPLALLATSALQLDRLQYRLTGVNGLEDTWSVIATGLGLLAGLVAIGFVVKEEIHD